MANELSKDEEAAFSAMQAAEVETSGPEPIEPESEGGEAEEPDAAPAADGKDKRTKFVPHEALHQEREEHRKTQAELQKAREERARFDERLQTILRMQQQQREEPEPEQKPDPDDWVGRLEYAERKLAEMEQGGQQQTEQQREQARVAHLASAAADDAHQFRAKTPDYGQAYEFWKTNRAEELAAFGVPAAQIPTILGNEQLSIAANAFHRGVSPAETLYAVAKHRGYKAKAPANGDGGDGDGAAEQIERVERGQQRSVSLSGTGGGAAPTEMTAARLLAMSSEEFDEWTSKNPAKTRRLMGEEPRRRGA